MRNWIPAALVVCVACDAGSAAQAPAVGVHTSGTRLRARVVDGGEGAILFSGWQDTALGAACRFHPSTGGVWRCLPGDVADLYGPLGDFVDAACTQPARIAPAGASATVLASHGCPGAEELWDVVQLEEVAGAATYFHRGDAGCTETPVPDGQRLHRVVPGEASGYVAAHVVTEARGGGLDAEVLVADDGARQLGRSVDHARAAACAPLDVGVHPEALDRCLPAGIDFFVPGYFASADCTGDAAGSFSCPMADGCPVPEVAFDETVSADGCTSSFALRTLGPVVQAYREEAGVCSAQTFGPCRYQSANGERALDAYPALGRTEVGSGRLRALFRTAAGRDEALASLGRFHDLERDEVCAPARFVDGALRCAPEGARAYNQGLTFFTDATCTQAIVTADGSCANAPIFALELEDHGAVIVVGAAVRAVHAVGAPWSGTPYLVGDAGCVQSSSVASGWLVGDGVDAAAFATLSERIE